MRRNAKIAAVVAGLLAALAARPTGAHIVPVGVGMQISLKVEPRKVSVEYNLGFSDLTGYEQARKVDKDRDYIVTQEEIDAWMAEVGPKLAENVRVTLDGKPLAWKIANRRVLALFPKTDLRRVSGLPFDTFWNLECDVEVGSGRHTITVADTNFQGEVRQLIVWLPKPLGDELREFAWQPEPKSARSETYPREWAIYEPKLVTVYVEFDPAALPKEETLASAAPAAGTAAPPAGSEGLRRTAEAAAKERGVEYRGAEEIEETRRLIELRGAAWYVGIALALLWGAAHALAPGHGKSMVAAYLLGTEGRIGDAVALGGIVTLAHAGSIFVIAVAAFAVAEHVFGVSQAAFHSYSAIWLEVAAGACVALMGLGILWRRIRQLRRGEALADHTHGPGGHHHHGHGHGHEHEHEHAKVGTGADLLTLGLAAGLQPCTAGLALVAMSINQGWLWKGLYLLVAFSAGLGMVLVAIAVAMVIGKKVLKDQLDSKEGRFIRTILPLVSATALAAVGVWMAIECLMRNRIGPFAT